MNSVDDRLFGHFMERASFGEPGYDAARDLNNPRALDPKVVELLSWLNIPLVRWPAGADLDKIDWRDSIDNVPGRDGPRPVFARNKHGIFTNEFGLDEFLALCEKQGWKPLLPVRFRPVLFGQVTPAEGAREAASLVAYCNAKKGAAIPEGLDIWPEVRAKNGRSPPWKVPYFQIGNETWLYFGEALKARGLSDKTDKEKAEWYLTCLRAYLAAIHQIDPESQIIVDGTTGAGRWVDQFVLNDPFVRQHVSFYALHMYQPWAIKEVRKNGEITSPDKLTCEDIWYCYVATPAINRETFQSDIPSWPDWWLVRDLDLPLAVTEWNWNGWWRNGDRPPEFESELAKGLGAAGMLHAFMRNGDVIKIACQSMLVGKYWGITGVRVSEDKSPRLLPTAMVTGLYSRHHGRERLFVEIANTPTYVQSCRINSIAPAPRVAFLVIVATRNDNALYLHVINRHRDENMPLEIVASRIGPLDGIATFYVLSGPIVSSDTTGYAEIREKTIKRDGDSVFWEIPARSVCVVEMPFKKRLGTAPHK